MLYVGLDIHTKHIALCVLSQAGQVVQRGRVRGLEEVLRLLRGLPDRYEVSCGYGHYHDLLQPLAARVLVAHPGHLRLIFRSRDKNDRKDAERLAKLLYLGETPTVHVPSLDVRTWRELFNCRTQVIAKRTRAKNTLRALLRGAGVVPPRHPGLWTKKGLAWLRQLDPPTASQQLRRDLLLEEVEALGGQVRRLEQELSRRAQQAPAVARLRSIPGWASARPRRWPRSSTTRTASARPRRSAGTSGWCRARTSPATRTGWGTSRAKGHWSSAGWWPRPPGRRCGARPPSARTSSGPGAATRSGRRSRWWPRRTTWYASCGRCGSGDGLAGERGLGRVPAGRAHQGGLTKQATSGGHEAVRVVRGGRRSFAATPLSKK
jgi:hypothetical protein